MKAIYDPRTDTLTLELKPGPVAESDEGTPGVILDYDEAGTREEHLAQPSCRHCVVTCRHCVCDVKGLPPG